ncbi:MAG TPA: YgcG family protein [Methylophilaceae bacterium]|jgi:uncharacterized protein
MMQRFLLTLCLLLLPLAGVAQVAVPPLTARVTDQAGVLSTEQKVTLESRLAALEQEKGSQVAILTVPTTSPETIEQYGIRVAESWKLGRKGVDDGLLILLAIEDRVVRIEVGYGLEGVIPDAIAKRIIAETMTPHFQQGDFYGGLDAAVTQLAALISGEPLPPSARQDTVPAIGELLPLLLFVTIAVGGIFRALFGRFFGGSVSGGIVGGLVLLLGGGIFLAVILGFIAFILTLSGGVGSVGGSGGMRGGGFGGGGFSGGGGGFGGGGASGRW